MAKKRKAGGRPAARNAPAPEKTKFSLEERFDESEDEFQTGRDQILLDEAPDAKRRRKLIEDGGFLSFNPLLQLHYLSNHAVPQSKISNPPTRKSWATSP